MKRFIIALAVLLATVIICVCGDFAFSSHMQKSEKAFSEALEAVQTGESPAFATAKIVRLSKKLDKIYFTCASRASLETLKVNSGVLADCLQSRDNEMYAFICSESLRLIQELRTEQKVSFSNII